MSEITIFERLKGWLAGTGRKALHLVDLYRPESLRARGIAGAAGLIGLALIVVGLVLGMFWSVEPDRFDVEANAEAMAEAEGGSVVTGYVTVAALERVAETLLDKAGGYLSNDVMPPGVLLDNLPSWEYGVLVQVRDLARALRNDWSRSQSQSVEDRDLATAEPQFNVNSESWMFPPSESEYREGVEALRRYRLRLNDESQQDSQFYARADNLVAWLAVVEKRLGSLSQRLSASVGQARINTDLAGESSAENATIRPGELKVKTSWLEIDDVFYQARGTTWALVHFLRGVEQDFNGILRNKNAMTSLRQVIRELEASQHAIWSPMILNGSGFGILANHSLVMASYVSRANSAVIDLRSLLERG